MAVNPIGSTPIGSTPPAPPPAAQARSTGTASPSASYDPADTNQDGVVSAAEALAYAQTHPQSSRTTSGLDLTV